MPPEVVTLNDDNESDSSNSHLITNKRKRKSAMNSTNSRRSHLNSRSNKQLSSVTKRKVKGGSECSSIGSEDKENVGLPERNKGRVTRRRDLSNIISDVDLVIDINEKQVMVMEPSNRYYGYNEGHQNDMEEIKLDFKTLDVDADIPPANACTSEDIEVFIHNFAKHMVKDGGNKTRLPSQRRQSTGDRKKRDTGSLGENFEVDFIVYTKRMKNEVYYLVKWSNYSPKESSWVSANNLMAPRLVEAFNERTSAVEAISKKLRPDQKSFVPCIFDGYDGRKRRKWELLEIQFKWNTIIGEQGARIFIEDWSEKDSKNSKNLGFQYITKSIYSDKVTEALEKLDLTHVPVGCEENCDCNSKECCCLKGHGGVNYNPSENVRGTRIITSSREMYVIECGDHCKCDPKVCRQRVLQKGRTLPLVLFYEGGKGWGVRTVYRIPKRAFVGEYVGEVIPLSEAEQPTRKSTYQFGLDEEVPTLNNEKLVIDAEKYGNETKFINHSCDPNLHARYVITNKYGPYDIRIAFYAARDIEPGEELTFDYYRGEANKKTKKSSRADITCRCGASNCRKYLPVTK